jgi:drug/metabolite transporter (DMT)-like permease
MKTSFSPVISGTFALLGSTFIYGFFGILSRVIGYSLPIFYQTAFRSIIATLILFFMLKIGRSWKKLDLTNLFWISVRSLFGSIAIVCFFIAVNKLPLGTVYFVFYGGSTIAGFILGAVLFNEKMTFIKTVSLLLSLVGLYMIYSLSIQADMALFALLSLTSGVCTGFWNTLSKKISSDFSSVQLSYLDNLLGGVFGIAVSLILREVWVFPAITTVWGINILFALLYVATGQLVIYGFRKIDAQTGSLIMLTEVLFGIMLGFFLYKETVSPLTFAGGALILFAIAIPEFYAMKLKKS